MHGEWTLWGTIKKQFTGNYRTLEACNIGAWFQKEVQKSPEKIFWVVDWNKHLSTNFEEWYLNWDFECETKLTLTGFIYNTTLSTSKVLNWPFNATVVTWQWRAARVIGIGVFVYREVRLRVLRRRRRWRHAVTARLLLLLTVAVRWWWWRQLNVVKDALPRCHAIASFVLIVWRRFEIVREILDGSIIVYL